jgi:hypothetical protein
MDGRIPSASFGKDSSLRSFLRDCGSSNINWQGWRDGFKYRLSHFSSVMMISKAFKGQPLRPFISPPEDFLCCVLLVINQWIEFKGNSLLDALNFNFSFSRLHMPGFGYIQRSSQLVSVDEGQHGETQQF